MPATVNMTVLGRNKAVARATSMSTAGASSIDVLTLNHGLGVTPDIVYCATPRTIRAVASTGTPQPVLRSYNATQAIFELPVVNGAACAGDWDFVVERTHTIVR